MFNFVRMCTHMWVCLCISALVCVCLCICALVCVCVFTTYSLECDWMLSQVLKGREALIKKVHVNI